MLASTQPSAMTFRASGSTPAKAIGINIDSALDEIGGSAAYYTVESGSAVDRYKCVEVIFLEEALRKRIRAKVIEIGVSRAHSIMRQRKKNMAGRRLSSIYSVDDAGPAISLKELIATAAALDEDPLVAMFDAIKKRLRRVETSSRVHYYKSLQQLRDEVAAQKKPRRRIETEGLPLLDLMERENA